MRKEWTYLQIESRKWRVSWLAEQVILLQANDPIAYEEVHTTSSFLKEILGAQLLDIVSSYDSIALFTPCGIEEIRVAAAGHKTTLPTQPKGEVIKLPICYELGLDLEVMARELSLSPEALMAQHQKGIYTAVFIGFSPGFVYADGLDPALFFPRRATPRKKVAAGSIGIGGQQTGIYSLDSPGGWNIVGRTPVPLFNSDALPPVVLPVGTRFTFYPITRREFESWES